MYQERKNEFLKGTLSLSISVVITKILGVMFKVPLSYVLRDEGMGYFNSAYAIYGFFYILCTAGVPKSVTLVLAKYKNENKHIDDLLILKYGLRLFGLIGVLFTLFNIACAPALTNVIGNRGAIFSLIAVAPSIWFVSLSGVVRGYLNWHEKLTYVAFSQVIEGVVKLVLGLVLALIGVRFNASVPIISSLAILGITVGSAMSFIYLMIKAIILKKDEKIEQNDIIPTGKIYSEIIKNALPISLSSSLLNLCTVLDLTIIIKELVKCGMSEQQANSVYGNYTTLAVPMFNLVIAILTPIATSYMPRLSKYNLKGDCKSFSDNLDSLVIITIFISVPAAMSFMLYSFDILDILFSVQSSALGFDSLTYLSFGLPLLALLTVVNTALESKCKVGISVFSLICGCIVKVFLTYVLIGKAGFGIIGAPIGTAFSYLISLIISTYAIEINGVHLKIFLKLALFSLIGFVSFYIPYLVVYKQIIVRSSFLSMGMAVAISLLVYIFLALLSLQCMGKTNILKMHKKK